MSPVTFACRSTGLACEWSLEAETPAVILARAEDHFKCAHHTHELSDAQRTAISAAIHGA